jgi:uncharacterized membrane protein HdeD (DUF308 family)
MSAQISEKPMMLSAISRTWWLAALRGALAVVFGVAAFVSPGLTFDVLVLLFGAYAFVDGVAVLSFGLMAAGEHRRWWPLVVGGIVGLAIGVLTFVQPAATALALVYVIGAWAIATGVLEVIAAIRLRKVITTEWLMGFSGAISIVFGALVLAQPGTGALALVFLFGYYAILAGVSQIALGFRLRRLGEARQPHPQGAAT